MLLGKDATGNPVINIKDGRTIGKLRDLYLTRDCKKVAGLYMGTEGLFSRKSFVIDGKDVAVIGPDAILVNHADVMQEEQDFEANETWLRRDDLQGRPVDTPGGTKVGRIGDIIINETGEVVGYSLGQVYVAGPIAQNGAIAIHAVQDTGRVDGVMTIDLEEAEQQTLSVGNGQMAMV